VNSSDTFALRDRDMVWNMDVQDGGPNISHLLDDRGVLRVDEAGDVNLFRPSPGYYRDGHEQIAMEVETSWSEEDGDECLYIRGDAEEGAGGDGESRETEAVEDRRDAVMDLEDGRTGMGGGAGGDNNGGGGSSGSGAGVEISHSFSSFSEAVSAEVEEDASMEQAPHVVHVRAGGGECSSVGEQVVYVRADGGECNCMGERVVRNRTAEGRDARELPGGGEIGCSDEGQTLGETGGSDEVGSDGETDSAAELAQGGTGAGRRQARGGRAHSPAEEDERIVDDEAQESAGEGGAVGVAEGAEGLCKIKHRHTRRCARTHARSLAQRREGKGARGREEENGSKEDTELLIHGFASWCPHQVCV
jgi:hypothetical protein